MSKAKKIYESEREINHFLSNEKVTADLKTDVLDIIDQFKKKATTVFIKESEEKKGFIVDCYHDDEHVDTATFQY